MGFVRAGVAVAIVRVGGAAGTARVEGAAMRVPAGGVGATIRPEGRIAAFGAAAFAGFRDADGFFGPSLIKAPVPSCRLEEA